MKYLSIAITPSSENLEVCQILEICIILEDTEKLLSIEKLPMFYGIINYSMINGDAAFLAEAVNVIAKLSRINIITNKFNYLKENRIFTIDLISKAIFNWLLDNGYETVISNSNIPSPIEVNVASDMPNIKEFLSTINDFSNLIKINPVIIDPRFKFINWEGHNIPSIDECKLKHNIQFNLEDICDRAKSMIELIRISTNNYNTI